MSELRQDRTTGGWVIIAPQRSRRPQTGKSGEHAPKLPRFDPSCPFCPGHENQLPGIITEISSRDALGWSVRVVPNKFPAVQVKPTGDAIFHSGHRSQPGFGVHEVIIESPSHDTEPANLAVDELNLILKIYRERSRVLLARDDIAAIILFRNYGPQSGASLAHPHAQIIALGIVPPKLTALSDWTRRYHQENASCAMCNELAIERKDGTRIVDENDSFVALVPFAAEHPSELWIVPKEHQPSFTVIGDNALGEFAAIVGRSLRRLKFTLDDPPYNFVFDSAPKAECAAPYWHWKLRIVPDVAIWGGFELGGGLPINPSSPEDDARVLRDVVLGS
jgi:UDPglucose--hexose-1-phosphate uridylyltransferase